MKRIVSRHVAWTALAGLLAMPALPALMFGQGFGGARSTKPISVVLSGGLTVPSGDLKELHDTGFHYDGSVIFRLPGLPIALRPELSLTTLKFKENLLPAPGTVPGTITTGEDPRTQLLAAMGNIEIPLAGGLYAIAGLGALNTKTKVGDAESEGQTSVTFGAGAGFRFHISRIDGFVEGRFGAASYEKGKVGYKQAQFIPVSFGLVF